MIETAGRPFKRDGIDRSGIATLVADAGLTNDAFYGHFTSKDDQVATVVAQQLADPVAVNSLPTKLASVEAFLHEHLPRASRRSRWRVSSAALLDGIGWCDVPVREASSTIRAIAHHLDDGDPTADQRASDRPVLLARRLVQAARAVTDSELSDRILAAAFTNAMSLASAPQHPVRPTRQETE